MATPRIHPLVQQARAALYRGNPAAAAQLCQQRLDETPRDANARLTLSDAQLMVGRTEDAIESLRTAARHVPNDPMVHIKMAQAMYREGRLGEALDACDQAIKLQPRLDAAIAMKGQVLSRQGKHTRAIKVLKPGLDAASPAPWYGLPVMQSLIALERYDDAEAFGQRYVAAHEDKPQQLREVLFELARVRERLDRPDEAFETADRANSVLPPAWDRSAETVRLNELQSSQTRDALAAMPTADVPADAPPVVLIVGMPRSGSTLVERILHAHPDATGIGEHPAIHRVLYALHGGEDPTSVPYPAALASMTPAQVAAARDSMLHAMRLAGGRGRVVVNKNLGNILHLGALSRIIPEIRVVRTVRDPLDTCLSCWMEPLGMAGTAYASSFEDLAWYHHRLEGFAAHWRDHLDVPMLDLSYESLVADPEAGVRSLLEFVGLPWNDACMKFHEVKRVERTLSFDQVTKPMYTTSVKRAEKFGERLDPLRTALADANASAG